MFYPSSSGHVHEAAATNPHPEKHLSSALAHGASSPDGGGWDILKRAKKATHALHKTKSERLLEAAREHCGQPILCLLWRPRSVFRPRTADVERKAKSSSREGSAHRVHRLNLSANTGPGILAARKKEKAAGAPVLPPSCPPVFCAAKFCPPPCPCTLRAPPPAHRRSLMRACSVVCAT